LPGRRLVGCFRRLGAITLDPFELIVWLASHGRLAPDGFEARLCVTTPQACGDGPLNHHAELAIPGDGKLCLGGRPAGGADWRLAKPVSPSQLFAILNAAIDGELPAA
jgi:hypothetical protein